MVVFADKWFLHGSVVPLEANIKDVLAEFKEIRHLDLFALNLESTGLTRILKSIPVNYVGLILFKARNSDSN